MGRNLLKQPLINYFIELRLQIGYIFAGQVKAIHEKIRAVFLNLVDFFLSAIQAVHAFTNL